MPFENMRNQKGFDVVMQWGTSALPPSALQEKMQNVNNKHKSDVANCGSQTPQEYANYFKRIGDKMQDGRVFVSE